MNENVSHIISRFKWDSYLDDQAKARELQERLSDWSRMGMVREMAVVFDKVCPPEQTWRIQTLELDLGVIDFNHLEFQLTEKLRSRLKEQLMDLLLYAGRGSHRIEILSQNSSHVDMIANFLQYGLMPWTHKPADGSVNQMLAQQLQTNPRQVIQMLKVVAIIHEDVRKRMAWQIKEPHIIKIIEGLEPNHHAEIIDFSIELSMIQSKETIVQTSYTGFRKHLWLWVLNYLFTDRGTIFNRVAFMKSNIRQMANHYNTGYGELLVAIKRSVAQVRHYHAIKTSFILALDALTAEDDTAGEGEQAVDFWEVLQGHFLSRSRTTDINELVHCLSRQDPQRFRRIAVGVGKTPKGWASVVRDLNDASLEALFVALAPAGAAILVEHIHFLIGLARETNLPMDRKDIWVAGLTCIQADKSHPLNPRTFMGHCISGFSEKLHVSRGKILEQWAGAHIPSAARTPATLDMYTQLIAQNNASFWSGRCKEWLDLLSDQLNSGVLDKQAFTALQKALQKNMQCHPKKALEAFLHYPDKRRLKNILPYLLNDHLIGLLVKNTPPTDRERVGRLLAMVNRRVAQSVAWSDAPPAISLSATLSLPPATSMSAIPPSQPATSQPATSPQAISPQAISPRATAAPAFPPLATAERKGLLDTLILHLITRRQAPSWFVHSAAQEAYVYASQDGMPASESYTIDLLRQVIIHYPEKLRQALARSPITEPQMSWLSETIDVKTLLDSISLIDKGRASLLGILEQLHRVLGTFSVGTVSGKEMQYILFRKLVKAWISGDWRFVSTENIWNEMVWSLVVNRGVMKKDLIRQWESGKYRFPPALQIAWAHFTDRPGGIKKPAQPPPVLTRKTDRKGSISVRNAGLVLVNSYLKTLLERLGLLCDNKFTDRRANEDAVHYLQYVVTGLCYTEESLLPLNKLLCGLPLSHPVEDGLDMPEAHKALIDGLIKAVIGHWPVIGSCSIEGFRGNWLVRDGLLLEQEDRWELTVEKRAYDLLIHQSPFSFSIIKHPWMDKPLHVCWPY